MAKIGPFPLSVPPVRPGVYEIEGWSCRAGPTYARFTGDRWLTGGAWAPELAGRRYSSGPLNEKPALNPYGVEYRWYGVDEATSKGTA